MVADLRHRLSVEMPYGDAALPDKDAVLFEKERPEAETMLSIVGDMLFDNAFDFIGWGWSRREAHRVRVPHHLV